MKKTIFLLSAAVIFLASCGSNNQNQGQTKEQVDSAVNAGVAAKEAAIKAHNDSVIAEEASAKAKRHENERGSEKHHTSEHSGPATTAPVAPPPPPPPPVVGGGKAHADQNQDNPNKAHSGGGKAHADQNQK